MKLNNFEWIWVTTEQKDAALAEKSNGKVIVEQHSTNQWKIRRDDTKDATKDAKGANA